MEKSLFTSKTQVNQENISSQLKAVKPITTDTIVIPPSRVWDKIEKILDEQDVRRKQANKVIVASFANAGKTFKRKELYLATVAAVGLLVGIFFIVK